MVCAMLCYSAGGGGRQGPAERVDGLAIHILAGGAASGRGGESSPRADQSLWSCLQKLPPGYDSVFAALDPES